MISCGKAVARYSRDGIAHLARHIAVFTSWNGIRAIGAWIVAQFSSMIGLVKIARHGNQELKAEVIDEKWIRLRTAEDDELLTLSLVEAAELVALLRGQMGLLAFGMGRTERRAGARRPR